MCSIFFLICLVDPLCFLFFGHIDKLVLFNIPRFNNYDNYMMMIKYRQFPIEISILSSRYPVKTPGKFQFQMNKYTYMWCTSIYEWSNLFIHILHWKVTKLSESRSSRKGQDTNVGITTIKSVKSIKLYYVCKWF